MKVLLPLDGSELAEIVFEYAKELAGRMSLELILLHVCRPSEDEMLPIHRAYIQQHIDVILRDAKEIERKYSTDKEFKKIKARGDVVVGYPAEEIIHYADKKKVDLILMASHGRSGVKRWALGSVADKVLHASNVPVWLVRPSIPKEIVYDKLPKRNLLVPLDGSKLAESVLPYVKIAAEHRGADLISITLLMVCEPPLITFDYTGAVIPVKPQEVVKNELNHRKKTAEQYLSIVKNRLEKSGISAETKVIVGSPTAEIIKYANANPSNLIVIATHGHTGIGRLAYGSFGSVAQKVLQEVTSPILMVRPH